MFLRKLHWISAALCFSCLLLFSVTGILLHHSKSWFGEMKPLTREGHLPVTLTNLQSNPVNSKKLLLSPELTDWIQKEVDLTKLEIGRAEIKDNQLTANFSTPGKSINVKIDLEKRDYKIELSDRGLVGYLNDLHKAKSTGLVWTLLMDLFAAACLLFAITGVILMLRNKSTQRQALPWVMSGLAIPVLVVLVFV